MCVSMIIKDDKAALNVEYYFFAQEEQDLWTSWK